MNNVRKARRSIDMTQQGLADAIKSTKSYVCAIESGAIKSPSIYKCYDIAKALGVAVVDLFPEVK